MAAFLAAKPHVEESGCVVDPFAHGDGVAGVEDDDGVGVRLLNGGNELILAGGEVHGLEVESFRFDSCVAAYDDDGYVSVRGDFYGFFEKLRPGLQCVLLRVLACHTDTESIGDLNCVAGAGSNSIEGGDCGFGRDQ